MAQLSKYQIKLRNDLIRKTWEERKSEITMTQLSEIFNMDLVYMFRIIKNKKIKELELKK